MRDKSNLPFSSKVLRTRLMEEFAVVLAAVMVDSVQVRRCLLRV